MMPANPPPRPASQITAVVVLLVSLAATAFAVWRERELTRLQQALRFQDGFAQVAPAMANWVGGKFVRLTDAADATLGRGQFGETEWEEFLKDSKWRKLFHGMKEIGYAEFADGHCSVKFVAGDSSPPSHPAGTDLEADVQLRDTIQKCANTGYGLASKNILSSAGSNATDDVVGFLPCPPPARQPDSSAAKLAPVRGLIFFVLNQTEYFRQWSPELEKMPLAYHLLAPGEMAPPNTPARRVIGTTSVSGPWRFVVTMKEPETTTLAPAWLVGLVGASLSGFLYFLFLTQARLRHAGALADEKISRQEAAEQKLQDALEREKELNRLKGNFVSMVTHEIRTPLAHIQGSSDILAHYLDRLPAEKRAQHFGFINSAVRRMSALMEDVLLFSKAEAGRMDFNPVAMDLENFCHLLADEIRSATNRRCPVEVQLEGVGEPARGDETLLRHIFTHLLVNAVKYSPAGTPVVFSITREGGMALFAVRDRGVGIPEEDRKELFTPFHRGKNVASLPGTGLGLIIVKYCIQQHGGRIDIDSAENAGTEVRVRLPMFSPGHTEFLSRRDHETKPHEEDFSH